MFQKAFFTPYIYILIFFFVFYPIKAQEIQLKLFPTDSISKRLLNNFKYDTVFYNAKEVEHELDSINLLAQTEGYLNSYFERTSKNDHTVAYNFTAGKQFTSISVLIDEALPISIRQKFNIELNVVEVATDMLETIVTEILKHYNALGYPFVTVQLKNQAIKDNKLVAFLEIKKNKLRSIDKIIIEGYPDFPTAFIKHQTSLKKTSVYNQQKLINASAALNKLLFVSELKPPAVLFTNDSTQIFLYLQKKKAHQFDGLLGFKTDENSSKLTFYGYANVLFNNLLNKGEQFSVKWNAAGMDRTNFLLNTKLPYLFNSPFSLEGSFELHKQDSTYLVTTVNTGLSYQLNAHQLKTVYQAQTSSLLNTTNNSSLAAFKKNLIGIGYSYELIKPTRIFSTIWETHFNAYTGSRTVEGTKTNQQQLEMFVNYTHELNNRNYIFVQNQSKKIISDDYYTNELYFIGGATTIRGFNEQQIRVAAYSILNLEYRFITANDSFLYSISDFGIVKNQVQNTNDALVGLGLGYAFKIPNGFLSLSYAIGKFPRDSFDFQSPKVHITWKQTF